MSLTLNLCFSKSHANALNKNITIIETVTCTLKDNTDILNPVFRLKRTMNEPFNYIECSELKRKYFVHDIKTVNGGMWEIACHVDVLSSFADDILKNEVITERQELKWNLMLNDNSFRCYQNPYIVQKEFPNGFSPSTSTYVLLVAGKPHKTPTVETE